MEMRMKNLITMILSVSALLWLNCGNCALSATIRVPQDQPTIQSGIVSAVAGDTVLVADGIYTGTGNKNIEYFGKAITVISENGPEMCIVDCQNSGRGFFFQGGEGSGSVLDGLTIRNGFVSGSYVSNRGGGILIGNGSSPVIRNCVITQNDATGKGAGIYVVSSNTVFENCVFSFNQGSGLYHDGSLGGPLTVIDCTFESNTSRGFIGYTTVNMTGCVIRNNMNTGVQCQGTVHNCVFTSNRATSGAGLYISGGTVTNCTFTDNFSAGEGGAIFCSPDSPIIIGGSSGEGNTFSNNIAGAGADIFCDMYDPVIINGMCNTFAGSCYSDYNVSPQEAFDLTGSISGETLVNQDVYVSTDGDDLDNGLSWATAFRTVRRAASKVIGTAQNPVTIHVASGHYSPSLTGERFPLAMTDFVRVEGESVDRTVFDAEYTAGSLVASYDQNCLISRMSLINGSAGVYNYQSTPVYLECDILGSRGSGLTANQGSVVLTNCRISDHAMHGILVSEAQLSLADCGIMHNEGHGVYSYDATLSLSTCMILDNHAMYNYGGGMNLQDSTVSVSSSLIWDNTASEDGGGISCSGDCVLDLANCVFAGNSAGHNGGALTAAYDCIINMINCTFTENSASRHGGAMSILFDCSVNVKDCILWNDTPDEIFLSSSPDVSLTYSVVQGGYAGEGNIDADPLLVSGPAGDFYLSQTAAGQSEDSPCLNAGSVPAVEACFGMSQGTVCMNELTSRSDDVTDSGPVDIGFHYFPGNSATPTPTPTHVPTVMPTATPTGPTPTPTEHPDGVDLFLNATEYHSGDAFSLRAHCFGPDGRVADLYVILDVMGMYWFYPDWTMTPGYETITLSDQHVNYFFILDFVWPSGDMGQGNGVRFWGAMCDSGTSDLLGDFDNVTFAWR